MIRCRGNIRPEVVLHHNGTGVLYSCYEAYPMKLKLPQADSQLSRPRRIDQPKKLQALHGWADSVLTDVLMEQQIEFTEAYFYLGREGSKA